MKQAILALSVLLALVSQQVLAGDYYVTFEDNVMVVKQLDILYTGDNIIVISEGKDVKPEILISNKLSDNSRIYSTDKGKVISLIKVGK